MSISINFYQSVYVKRMYCFAFTIKHAVLKLQKFDLFSDQLFKKIINDPVNPIESGMKRKS